ncbi:hypothetical protein GGX14DRAFT_545870 [Mycena pura]|uniref:Uncharacterized protein n=1 Tax=Mycena pura TaxID=153505 RepID=A0AAD6UVL7_9AGAR|nr:hypothetical protein GGX14DRAFT_545870 [Mycena pura]
MIFTTLVSLLALAAAAAAAPLQPQELVVISPQIISPAEGDCWPSGSTQMVVWDTSKIPPEYMHNHGMILLGHPTTTYDSEGHRTTNENLNISCPLATDFEIGTGKTNVTIPVGTKSGPGYTVVLFGDRRVFTLYSYFLLTPYQWQHVPQVRDYSSEPREPRVPVK